MWRCVWSVLVLLDLTAAANAEPEVPRVLVGATTAIDTEIVDHTSAFSSVQLGVRIAGDIWVTGSLGLAVMGARPVGARDLGGYDASGFETRAGAGKLWWEHRAGFGVVGSLGLQHDHVDYLCSLVDFDPRISQERDLLFVEGRGFAGLRLTHVLLIELSLGLRLGGIVRSQNYESHVPGIGGIVGGLGVNVTL